MTDTIERRALTREQLLSRQSLPLRRVGHVFLPRRRYRQNLDQRRFV